MKKMIPAFVLALAFAAVSCETPSKPTNVVGTIRCSSCSDTFSVNGDLSEGSAKYFGYCEVDAEENLTVVVGTDDRSHATSASDFYLSVTGVVGPPTEGVFDGSGDPKLDESLFTTFQSGRIKNVNEYAFSPDDASDPDLCNVNLYAVPLEGELDPNREEFDYYLFLDCHSLDVPPISGPSNLTWVEAELYLGNCR